MNALSTNKLKGNIQSLRKCSQTDLHVKILNLVANRIHPVNSEVGLVKQTCGLSTKYIPQSSNSTKRHSLATTRAKQGRNVCNKTICEGNQPVSNKNIQNYQANFGRIRTDLGKNNKRNMQITSKVISLSIDHTKIGDLTIDLRRQMPNEFVNIKMMNKFKLENAQKSRRITQLQHQIAELQQRVIELSFNLQMRSIGKQNASMLTSQSTNRITMNNDGKNYCSSQTQIWIDLQQQNRNQINKQQVFTKKKQSSQYEYLLRMLKSQAIQLQNCTKKSKQRCKTQQKTL